MWHKQTWKKGNQEKGWTHTMGDLTWSFEQGEQFFAKGAWQKNNSIKK